MEKNNPEIDLGVIIEFDFSEFVVRYDMDDKYWYAEHYDEETYPDLIVIEDEYFTEGVMILFGGFIFTKELFEQFKKVVEREEKNAT